MKPNKNNHKNKKNPRKATLLPRHVFPEFPEGESHLRFLSTGAGRGLHEICFLHSVLGIVVSIKILKIRLRHAGLFHGVLSLFTSSASSPAPAPPVLWTLELSKGITSLLRYKFQFTLTQTITLQTVVIRLQVPGRYSVPRYYLWEIKTGLRARNTSCQEPRCLSHGPP